MSDFTEIMQSLVVADQKIEELRAEMQRKDVRIACLESALAKRGALSFALAILLFILLGVLTARTP